MTAESTKLFITSVYKTIGKEYLSMSIEDRMREGKELLEQVCAEIKIPTTPRGEILIDEKGVGIFKVPKTQPSQAMGYFEQIKNGKVRIKNTPRITPLLVRLGVFPLQLLLRLAFHSLLRRDLSAHT